MFYDKVVQYCKENNISIMAFESKCDLANGLVRKWAEDSNPTLRTIIKIAKATETPVEYWVSCLTDKE